MKNFWKDLPAGFVGLSPMDGVTDHPFRHIQKKYGDPGVIYTEFTNVEGISHGASRLLTDFLFDPTQRPIVGQIFGSTPKDFRMVATILCQLGFDGVDINMGCPAKTVTNLGSGAALIKSPQLALEIIRQTKAGVQDWVNGKNVDDLDVSDEIKRGVTLMPTALPLDADRHSIPISVKTRIGYDIPSIETWIPTLLEEAPAAIALHGRTLSQRYAGLADWEQIARAAEYVRQTQTIIMGNGDVKSLSDASEKIRQYSVNGVLIGRAALGNPWVFSNRHPSLAERFAVTIEHAELYERAFSQRPKYGFFPMRKHLSSYIKDFPGASECRQQLVRAENAQEVRAILRLTEKQLQEDGVLDSGLEPEASPM